MRQPSPPLTGSLDLRAILEAILERAFDLLTELQAIHIFLCQANCLALGAELCVGRRKRQPADACPATLIYTIARQGQSVIAPDSHTHPLCADAPNDWRGAVAGLPLKIGLRLAGVMVAAYRDPCVLSEAELRTLRLLGDEVAVAIENARLYHETRRRACELAALIEVGHDISATLDLPTVLEHIAMHARDLLEADGSEVYLLEPDGQTLRAIVALGDCAEQVMATPLRLGEGIVGCVAQSWRAEMVNNVEQDPRAVHIPGTPEEAHALLCVPLICKDQLVGAMTADRRNGRGPFEQVGLDFLIGLSRQAAVAIVNARLYAAERQRAAELSFALEQQRELDRLKDEFVQNVSHELRTPLAIILGYAEMLACGDLGEPTPEQREPVSAIARHVRKLSRLVDDLTILLEAETRVLNQEPVDLADLIRFLLADFQSAAQRAGLTLTAEITPGLPLVCGDHVHLRRALDNLLGNALKFTSPGGVITVRLWRDDTSVLLEVSDTGIGIPHDKLERIFDRFYQVDGGSTRRYGGVGLGLALVKEIVEAHGGQVTVQSAVGAGSTFRVMLPDA